MRGDIHTLLDRFTRPGRSFATFDAGRIAGDGLAPWPL